MRPATCTVFRKCLAAIIIIIIISVFRGCNSIYSSFELIANLSQPFPFFLLPPLLSPSYRWLVASGTPMARDWVWGQMLTEVTWRHWPEWHSNSQTSSCTWSGVPQRARRTTRRVVPSESTKPHQPRWETGSRNSQAVEEP